MISAERTHGLARPLPRDLLAMLRRADAGIARLVGMWRDRRRMLRQLAVLPDYELRRMGITRADFVEIAREEAQRRADSRR